MFLAGIDMWIEGLGTIERLTLMAAFYAPLLAALFHGGKRHV
jgi:hypothetical protein